MESRLSGAVKELRALQQRGDTDIRVSEGAAGGATRILGYRKLSCRTLAAVASSHGFDASVCINESAPTVVIELVNRTVHSPVPISASNVSDFTERAKTMLGASSASYRTGGSCSTITFASSHPANAHVLNNILATARVVDVWAFKDKLVVLFAGTPKHTSALTHLREHRPEFFSPQHCRSVADRLSGKRTKAFKKKQ